MSSNLLYLSAPVAESYCAGLYPVSHGFPFFLNAEVLETPHVQIQTAMNAAEQMLQSHSMTSLSSLTGLVIQSSPHTPLLSSPITIRIPSSPTLLLKRQLRLRLRCRRSASASLKSSWSASSASLGKRELEIRRQRRHAVRAWRRESQAVRERGECHAGRQGTGWGEGEAVREGGHLGDGARAGGRWRDHSSWHLACHAEGWRWDAACGGGAVSICLIWVAERFWGYCSPAGKPKGGGGKGCTPGFWPSMGFEEDWPSAA
jgi:hypothetical protein